MVFHKDPAAAHSDKHKSGGHVRCHHCHAAQLLENTCPVCGKRVTTFGLGTQRVEEEITRKFPDITPLRMDSDTMQRGADYHEALEKFRHGEVRVLVGTQMIAKGLDFPNVRLVGVISADSALHMPDFRAAERTFQLVAQVAGRAGRGTEPGLVIVQSFNATDPAITLAAQHDYETFARRELELRAGSGLPPITRMARIVVRDRDHAKGFAHTQELATHLHAANTQLGGKVRVRGPMACPIARIAGYHRHQVELIAPDAGLIQTLLTALRNAKLLRSDHQTAVDVDPVAML
jgi:primosomal protein N' (replication factor Y)